VFSPDEQTHVEIVKYPDKSNAMKWFFGLAVEGAPNPFLRSMKLLYKTFTHPRQFFKTLFNFRWSTNMVIFLVMQTVDNAMKIVWKKGIFGGRISIDNKGQRKVPAYIPVGQMVMERYAQKVSGISQNILLEVFFDRPTTAHILGGCPMGNSAETGVVDSDLRLHGYPNMYVMDGSVIQGNIGVNPSLTITAMAEYAMSRIEPKEDNQDNGFSQQLNLLEKEWTRKKFN
jgi:cholesterol oxidase